MKMKTKKVMVVVGYRALMMHVVIVLLVALLHGWPTYEARFGLFLTNTKHTMNARNPKPTSIIMNTIIQKISHY